MNINDLIKLIDAGFTKEEIAALTAAPAAPAAPAVPAAPAAPAAPADPAAPAAPAAPAVPAAPAAPAAPADPAAPAEIPDPLSKAVNALLQQMQTLTAAVQAGNTRAAGGDLPKTETVEDIINKMFEGEN